MIAHRATARPGALEKHRAPPKLRTNAVHSSDNARGAGRRRTRTVVLLAT